MTNSVWPGGATSNVVYDAIGRVTSTIDPRGNTNYFVYDPNCGCSGRQSFITNALGEVTRQDYDANGNLIKVTDALNRVTQYVYDRKDRRTHTIFHDGTQLITTYDTADRRLAETDQNTNTTWFAYDGQGRLVAVTNALSLVTTYTYDEEGNLTSQTDANNHTTTFEYDTMGRRIKRTLPGSQVETYAYDAAGNMTNKVDFNGRATEFTYDSMNRLLSKKPDPFFNAPTVFFTYTATGQRETMVDASGVTIYSYNERDWLTNKVTPQGTLSYTFDLAGNVTTIKSANANGIELGYTWDELNRLKSASEPESGDTFYSYDPVGNLEQVLYPNGVATLYRYDHLYRLTNMVSGRNGNTIADYHYTVAPSGHRLTASEAIVAATNNLREVNRAYGYDGLYRLTGENLTAAGVTNLPSNASVAYTHDNVGNRLTRTSNLPGIENQSFGYNANDWILTDTYDNNGNTIQGRVIQSLPPVADQYDYEDRLISRNNGQVTIVYDGDGNRVRKTVNGVTTLYLVDDRNPTGYAQVLEELTSTGGTPAITRLYVYGADLIAQQQLNGNNQWEATFYGYDAHGNSRYLTDLSGNVTDTYDYDAFGDLIAQTGTTPNLYLYCGEQFDGELGFYYLRARYLNADSGRFWTRDTFEGNEFLPISRNHYLYANADPVGLIDPLGLFSIQDMLGAMGVNNIKEAARAISANKARRTSVKTLGCVVGIESIKVYMEYELSGKTQKHHSIPRSMGGPDKNLLPLPSNTHRMFHFALHILLKESDQFGGLHNYSEPWEWAQALVDSNKKKALLQVLKTAGAYVDKQCKYPKERGIVEFIKMNEDEWLK